MQADKLCTPVLGSVRRFDQADGLAAADGRFDLLEPDSQRRGALPKPQQVKAAGDEALLDQAQ